MESMFERYGGFAKVSRVVSSFYDRVLESPIMGPYFHDIDMKRQIDHQTKFIAFLMGGPASYSDEHLKFIHQRMKIERRALEEMVELMTETLEDFDFSDTDIDIVRRELLSRANLIVAEGP
ncbi:MAG: group 1 truncated hemoglobin [Pseudomonadota bacterium]